MSRPGQTARPQLSPTRGSRLDNSGIRPTREPWRQKLLSTVSIMEDPEDNNKEDTHLPQDPPASPEEVIPWH